MTEATPGKTVKIHYTGKLEDGTVFDTTQDKEPFQFVLGEGKVIPAFEKHVEGMNPGDKKNFSIPAEEAYGERSEQMIVEVGRENLPEDLEPQVGQQLEVANPGTEQKAYVQVVGVSEKSVTLDGNHPLAGKQLNFEIELVEVG